jgi:hypothetical protein
MRRPRAARPSLRAGRGATILRSSSAHPRIFLYFI